MHMRTPQKKVPFFVQFFCYNTQIRRSCQTYLPQFGSPLWAHFLETLGAIIT